MLKRYTEIPHLLGQVPTLLTFNQLAQVNAREGGKHTEAINQYNSEWSRIEATIQSENTSYGDVGLRFFVYRPWQLNAIK